MRFKLVVLQNQINSLYSRANVANMLERCSLFFATIISYAIYIHKADLFMHIALFIALLLDVLQSLYSSIWAENI